jgi:hypothetical protein
MSAENEFIDIDIEEKFMNDSRERFDKLKEDRIKTYVNYVFSLLEKAHPSATKITLTIARKYSHIIRQIFREDVEEDGNIGEDNVAMTFFF